MINAVLLSLILFGCSNSFEIQNPYEQVIWKKHKQYKANLHTHTTISDGHLSPQFVVDWYHEHGYSILAITDHNEVSYPWTAFSSMKASEKSETRVIEGVLPEESVKYENRNPEELGMIAIQGNEVSSPQHIGSLFNDFGVRTSQEDSAIAGIGEKNGLIIFNHPGRYKHEAQWYTNFCRKYKHIVGVEIYNNGDRYSGDRQLWDSILVDIFPERMVWAYSNDDMHQERSLGRNWNIFVLPELTREMVRKGIEEGRSFYVYAPFGHEGAVPPRVNSIHVNKRKALIEIESAGYDSIRWISAGKVISRGNIIQIKNDFRGNYVRAEIFGKDKTIVGTQPFGIKTNQ